MAALTRERSMRVWYDEAMRDGGVVRRIVCEDVRGVGEPRLEFWWHIPEIASLPEPPVLDSLLGGPLLWAAMSGQDVLVEGPVSAGGLYNLGQLLEIRQHLSPERYPRRIELRAAKTVTVARNDANAGSAIAALSGGLDSTFTAVRHALGLAGAASIPIRSLVMVHGFDAPLDRPDQFDAMRRRTEPLAAMLGIPLHTVRTNSKMGARTWPHSAIPLTVAALSHFAADAGIALVSSGAPYGIPRFGISHPTAIEALASGDWFRVVTDGSGFGRSDKIEALLPYPAALAGIKVCWQGNDPSRNCGKCEKCVMTRLNFLAAGMRDAPCFDEPLGTHHVAALDMSSMSEVRDLFRTCWNELEARGMRGPEVELLRKRLSRVPPDVAAAWVIKTQARAGALLPTALKRTLKRVLR